MKINSLLSSLKMGKNKNKDCDKPSTLTIYLIITVIINIAVRIVVKGSPLAAEWYALNIYPFIVRVVGGISGLFSFSVGELQVIFLIVLLIFGVCFFIFKLIRGKGKRKSIIFCGIKSFFALLSTVLVFFLFGCEINYSRYPFSYYSNFEVGEYTKEELREVIDRINFNLKELSEKVEYAEDGSFILRADLETTAISAMKSLGKRYPSLDAFYPMPKTPFFSELILSNSRICGVFSPFAIEANYNSDMPDIEKPFTVAHELSHLSGFMREDEANFIAYLAAKESGDIDFLYSAYVKALMYASAPYYYIATEEEYRDFISDIPYKVIEDVTRLSEYWESYTALSELSLEINDVYLKVNGQEDGIQSYGRFVDLLIAEYYYYS